MMISHKIDHHLMFSDLGSLKINDSFEISAQEAHHAVRVKRIAVDDKVGVLDAKGLVGVAIVRQIAGSRSKPVLSLELCRLERFDPISPRIEVYSALPKGDRLDRMVDQLAQLGVSGFRPLLCDRAQRKPTTMRLDKLERIANEAVKQCHRPWGLEINDPIPFADALEAPHAVIADASGEPWSTPGEPRPTAILIGPEGGWSDAERARIAATDRPVVRFGLFVLRIEAAAAAASAIVLSTAPQTRGTPL